MDPRTGSKTGRASTSTQLWFSRFTFSLFVLALASLPVAAAQTPQVTSLPGTPQSGPLNRAFAGRLTATARGQRRNGISGARVTPDAPLAATPEAGNSGDPSLTNNQIIFAIWNGGNGSTDDGNRVEQFGVSGSSEISGSAIDLGDGSQSSYSGLNYLISGIAVDTAMGRYYAFVDNPITYTITIQMGSLTGGGVTTVFTVPFPDASDPNNNGTFVIPEALALDAQSGTLYFAQAAENADTGDTVAADTGIYRATIAADGSISAPTLLTSITAGLVNPDYVVLDLADNLAFFTDSIEAGDGFPATDNLDEVNLITGAVTVMIENFFPTTDENDLMQGLALNGNTLYLATVDYGDNTSTNNQILSIPLTVSGSGSTANATAGSATVLYSGTGADQPIDIAIDAANGIFYTTGEQYISTGTYAGNYYGAVYEGSLSGGASLAEVLSMSTVVTNGDAAVDTDPVQLVLLTQPTITAGGTATATSGDGAVTVDSGVTVSDPDGQNLASATVSIASGFATGDTLSFTNQNGITGSFSSGTLTLTGAASAADYQAGLDSVTFSTTSTSTTARTIDWTVSDGVVSSATATSTVAVLLPTAIISVTSVSPASEVYGLDSGITITAVLSWTGTGPAPTASDVTIGGTGPSGYGATSCGAPSSDTMTCMASYTPTAADTVGTYTESASFSGDSNYTGSSSTQTNNFSITQATTSTSVASSQNPSLVGQSVTFTATIDGEYGLVVQRKGALSTGGMTKRSLQRLTQKGQAHPLVPAGGISGTVTWSANTGCGPTSVSGDPGTSQCVTTTLPQGTDTITATYSGDSNHTGSTGTLSGSQVVNPAATLNIVPSSLNFDTVYLNSKHRMTLTITNDSAVKVIFTGVTITPGTSDAAAYTPFPYCIETHLDPGKSCTIGVDLLADAVGTLTATLNIVDSAGTQQVSLTANVIDPVAQFNMTTLKFGPVPLNGSLTLPVQLMNIGETDLDISNVTITGANSSEFSPINLCTASLTPTSSCTIEVTFAPTAKGAVGGTLVVTDNVTAGKTSIPISGTGH